MYESNKVTHALSDANLIVSGATAAMLFVGRFAFLPFQRMSVEKAGRPKQNDQDYFEAGDVRSAEAFSVMKTNDPAGFNLVDGRSEGSTCGTERDLRKIQGSFFVDLGLET